MQDPTAAHRPRSSSMASLHQRAAKATCGLIRRPSQRDPQAPVEEQEQQPETMHSPTQDQPSSLPRRRTSLRERFWSVNSANSFKEADRERRQRESSSSHQNHSHSSQQAYTPRHAATDFSAQMTQQRRENMYDVHEEGDAGSPREDDYALFVERSEMLDEAARREEAMMLGRTKSQKRRSLGRRIAEYVKPPREEP